MQATSRTNKKLGLVITDGVGYRNFYLSNFLEEAVLLFDKIIIYSGLPQSVYDLREFENVKVVELPIFKESFQTWFWRKSKEVAHLQNHKENFGIKDNLLANRSTAKSNRGYATRLIYKFTNFFHSEDNNRFYERQQERTLKDHEVTRFCEAALKRNEPDVLFFTHQRPPYVVPLVVAADKLKIKTGSFIFSWDNLASKGRMAAKFQFYFVWSDLMKKELQHFYPKIDKKEIQVVGTPQFEPYVLDRYKTNRLEFYEKFNLNKSFKTLCYSCGDISTSENDSLYIETIAEGMEQDLFEEKLNFIVRTSPAEEPTRFEYLQQKYPFIIWNFPTWELARVGHPEPWSQRTPSEDDLTDLRMILEYSDLGINMCSTMSLDFMHFDKPVINPVFGNKRNGLYNDQRFLSYAHYKRVVESGAVAIAKNKDELVLVINNSLKNPARRIEEQKMLLKLQIGKALEGTGKRIASKLLNEIE